MLCFSASLQPLRLTRSPCFACRSYVCKRQISRPVTIPNPNFEANMVTRGASALPRADNWTLTGTVGTVRPAFGTFDAQDAVTGEIICPCDGEALTQQGLLLRGNSSVRSSGLEPLRLGVTYVISYTVGWPSTAAVVSTRTHFRLWLQGVPSPVHSVTAVLSSSPELTAPGTLDNFGGQFTVTIPQIVGLVPEVEVIVEGPANSETFLTLFDVYAEDPIVI